MKSLLPRLRNSSTVIKFLLGKSKLGKLKERNGQKRSEIVPIRSIKMGWVILEMEKEKGMAIWFFFLFFTTLITF